MQIGVKLDLAFDTDFETGITAYDKWNEWTDKWKRNEDGIAFTDPVTGSDIVPTDIVFQGFWVYDKGAFHY